MSAGECPVGDPELDSIALTVWVARTLFCNGRVFLIQAFNGNESMADAVNRLLVVGFYLINVGFVAFALRLGNKPETMQGAFEFVSTKLGVVMLVLGAMHFFNMFTRHTTHRDAVRDDHEPRPWRRL